jgi:murein DD-endopeptidase MepM/ murein hydrolase activator NlpD
MHVAKKDSTRQKEYLYYFPVQPPEYCNYTGHKQGDHHDYPASDIFAPFGTPIIAVTDGIIEWISAEDRWDPYQDDPDTRGGIAFALRGDDNIRYYFAHLSRFVSGIKLGMRIKAGQIIGYVGKSGNARFTPPHMHFGISEPTTPDDWETRRGQIWPGPYLDAWKKGEMRTPKLR